VPLDAIAKKILQFLSSGPRGAEAIATASTGGAARMASPRLVWLEGLGLIENVGANTFGITPLGLKFLEVLD
jgi:hypothetical protein